MIFIFQETSYPRLDVTVRDIYNHLSGKLNNTKRHQYIKHSDLSTLILSHGQRSLVIKILNSDHSAIASILSYNYGRKCSDCDCDENLQVDHIVPVCKGGGASWINNYQFLCKSCHKCKTKNDVKGVDRSRKVQANKSKACSFRLDEELLEALEVKAKQENRSLTNLVETILKEAVRGGKCKN